jgi:hydroxylamine reductase
MGDQMFCFQCEQTVGCEACTGRAGACGKPLEVAVAQDELTGALIGLARTCQAAGTVGGHTYELVVDGLFTCVTNVNFNEGPVRALIDRVHAEAAAVAQAAGVAAEPDYGMAQIWGAD